MAVLYQKYRPKRFSEVVGQSGIVRTLMNATKSGQLAHAYLFTGSRGIGKTTIARLVAKAANCQTLTDGDPCGVCDICGAIASDRFLDVIEIDAASHTGVDNIRQLIENVQFKPAHGKTKVFIIDEVHMLSKAAFNALLKTLEEPPSHVMFVMATTDIEKVPDTIISRTQRFDFRKISASDMLAHLESVAVQENLQLPEGSLPLIVTNSEGGMRDALSLLDTVAALGNIASTDDIRMLLGLTSVHAIEELVGAVVSKDAASVPAFFESQSVHGADFLVFNKNILEYLRLMLVYKITNTASIGLLDADQIKTMEVHSNKLLMPQLLYVTRLFLRSYKEIGQSPMPELPIMLAAVEATLYLAANTSAQQVSAAKSVSVAPAVKSAQTAPTTSFEAPTPAGVMQAKVQPDTILPPSVVEEELNDNDLTGITKEEVMIWWPEVVQRIKTVNSPLATLLKNSPLRGVSNGKITIAVKYLFHKEHLENTRHTALILETITAVCGKRMYFRSEIVKDHNEPVITNTVDALSDAIKIFGGELVE